MDFGLSAEQLHLQREIRAFAESELLPRYQEWDRTREFPFAAWRRMSEIGLTGMRVSEAYGGQNLDYMTVGLAAEEVARGDFNCAYAVLISALLGDMLEKHAGDAVKEKWLRAMATGEKIVAFALTEPGSGSDAAALRTTARREGDEYVLRGEKASMSLAASADAAVLFARTGPAKHDGVSAFLVPLDVPGVTRMPYRDLGSHAVGRGSIFLDDVRVPADHLIGAEGSGFRQVMVGFDFSRFLIGLMCVGAASITLEETMAYVKEREAFGQPLARFQGVSFPIAERLTMLEGARWMSYRGLWLREVGRPHTAEAAMVKWFAPKISVETIHDCLILHGHYGYTEDLPIQQRMRDVIGLEIGDGTPQVQKVIIAREILGRESVPYRHPAEVGAASGSAAAVDGARMSGAGQ